MAEMEDPVPVITRTHFEEALGAARKSVTGYVNIFIITCLQDLDKFEQFRKKYDPAYAAKVAGSAKIKINWPDDHSSQFQAAANDDDDLYS